MAKKKPARVPELKRMHDWVVLGTFELEMDEHSARRAVEAPEDFAMTWRDRAELVAVQGPGCRNCGVHAREGLGEGCGGTARLNELIAAADQPSRLWTPDQPK